MPILETQFWEKGCKWHGSNYCKQVFVVMHKILIIQWSMTTRFPLMAASLTNFLTKDTILHIRNHICVPHGQPWLGKTQTLVKICLFPVTSGNWSWYSDISDGQRYSPFSNYILLCGVFLNKDLMYKIFCSPPSVQPHFSHGHPFPCGLVKLQRNSSISITID